jgi:hypothetical protein
MGPLQRKPQLPQQLDQHKSPNPRLSNIKSQSLIPLSPRIWHTSRYNRNNERQRGTPRITLRLDFKVWRFASSQGPEIESGPDKKHVAENADNGRTSKCYTRAAPGRTEWTKSTGLGSRSFRQKNLQTWPKSSRKLAVTCPK